MSRRRKVIKIRAEINEIESKKIDINEYINESKGWFFEKTHRIEKSLTRFIKKTREKTKQETVLRGRALSLSSNRESPLTSNGDLPRLRSSSSLAIFLLLGRALHHGGTSWPFQNQFKQ